MAKNDKKKTILKLFDRAKSNVICVDSAYAIYANALITHLVKDGDEIRIYSGDPFDDETACEEIQILYKDDENKVFADILDNL